MKEIFVYALLAWTTGSGAASTPTTIGIFIGDEPMVVKKECDDAIAEYQTSYRMSRELGYGWLSMACVKKGTAQ